MKNSQDIETFRLQNYEMPNISFMIKLVNSWSCDTIVVQSWNSAKVSNIIEYNSDWKTLWMAALDIYKW